MQGKIKIDKKLANKLAAACELEDVVIRGIVPAGNNVVISINYKTAGNLVEVGRYLETLPDDAKPTPKVEKAPVAVKK